MTDKAVQLERIRRAIAEHGYWMYLVAGGASTDRYLYTIGLTESSGAEVVLSGAVIFLKDDAVAILKAAVAALAKGDGEATRFAVDGCGSFTLRAVHPTWVDELLLGATDYYKRTVAALQIVPDAGHLTIDVRDLSGKYSPPASPVSEHLVMTSLDVLRGERITHAARWEDDHWELMGAVVPEIHGARVVPLSTLIEADPSLAPVTSLAVGDAVCRDDPSSPWEPWVSKKN